MSQVVSPSPSRVYGLVTVARIWRLSRATMPKRFPDRAIVRFPPCMLVRLDAVLQPGGSGRLHPGCLGGAAKGRAKGWPQPRYRLRCCLGRNNTKMHGTTGSRDGLAGLSSL
jgi:hypothetical protein